jgi:hypothetical protein
MMIRISRCSGKFLGIENDWRGGKRCTEFLGRALGSLTSLRSSLGSMVEAWGNSSGLRKEKCLMLMITGSIKS